MHVDREAHIFESRFYDKIQTIHLTGLLSFTEARQGKYCMQMSVHISDRGELEQIKTVQSPACQSIINMQMPGDRRQRVAGMHINTVLQI